MSHIERRQRDKEEIRQRIIDAAREIAAKEGWQAVTIRRIADRIEYTPPIVYEYFESKEDLFKELVYFGFDILHKQFVEASQTESDTKKLLLKLAIIHWDFALQNKELFQLMFNLERPTPNEAMIYNMTLIEKTMTQISKGEKEIVRDLVFSFFCLKQGAITFMMQMDKMPHRLSEKDARKLFIRIMERFINSI
jgi:AcrR family transcriptional regulator